MEQLSPEWTYDGIRVALICSIVLFGFAFCNQWHNGCYCILKHEKTEKHVTEMKKYIIEMFGSGLKYRILCTDATSLQLR